MRRKKVRTGQKIRLHVFDSTYYEGVVEEPEKGSRGFWRVRLTDGSIVVLSARVILDYHTPKREVPA